MRAKKTRRATLALAALGTVIGLSFASPAPASANTLYGRVPAGGCITGVPVVVYGVPLCMVVD